MSTTSSHMPSEVEGIISKQSPFSVEETLEHLQAAIQQHNLKLFAHINHSEEARQVGLHMQEAHVLIFGNPQAGTPLMVAVPLIALELPLKLLIWQENEKDVWVSYTNPAYLASRYALPSTLVDNIAGLDKLIASALANHSS